MAHSPSTAPISRSTRWRKRYVPSSPRAIRSPERRCRTVIDRICYTRVMCPGHRETHHSHLLTRTTTPVCRTQDQPSSGAHMSHLSNNKRVAVTGAGGFIGHHLVTFLKARGYWVRGIDLKHPEFS